MKVFEDLGYACTRITPDYGEDFFVHGEDSGVIEPFRIFVQVRASEQVDVHESDWTEYEDPWTVRKWVLGNELVVLVRHNFTSGVTRYCIPEESIVYWDIDPSKNVPVHCSLVFDPSVADELIWRARIRHYDRIVRITQPNAFEDLNWNEVPQFRLFALEFLTRLSLLDPTGSYLADEFYAKQLPLTLHLIEDCSDSEDMTAYQKAKYAACSLLILTRLREVCGFEIGLAPFFLDQCACVLVQLVRHRTDLELQKLPGNGT
jgi:hypothetical protein